MAERQFPCTTAGLADAAAFLLELCPEPKPAIILDEIVSNIVRCSGGTFFTISFDRTDAGSVMKFADDGRAFDPTADSVTPDISASVEDRQIGGLGIFMVKKMSKSVTYRRVDGRNELTVTL